jgi:hypothetical protein
MLPELRQKCTSFLKWTVEYQLRMEKGVGRMSTEISFPVRRNAMGSE